MAQSYGFVNLISSFGFSHRWRRACVDAAGPLAAMKCADLMCGMGEAALLAAIRANDGPTSIDAFDFCPQMAERARRSVARKEIAHIHVFQRDVLSLPPEPSYHRIFCSFGLKTLDHSQLNRLAELVAVLLHPGGTASFVEIHVPQNRLLRVPYLAYMRYGIPLIGWLALGNPKCYRWLARYTEDFARRDHFIDQLAATGLSATTRPLYHGCARLYLAHKPA